MAGGDDSARRRGRSVRRRARAGVSDRRRHPRRRRQRAANWARPPARTPRARSRPTRPCSASSARGRWPPTARAGAHGEVARRTRGLDRAAGCERDRATWVDVDAGSRLRRRARRCRGASWQTQESASTSLLVERGLAPSRERARALILAGQVTVDGQVVSKAGTPVAADARVELVDARSSVRRAAAASSWRTRSTCSASTVAGRRALDIGASTGGFTDVLLQRGAASVDRARRRPRPARLAAAHRPARHRPRRRQRARRSRQTTCRTRSTSSRSTWRSSRCGTSCRRCRRSWRPARTSSRSSSRSSRRAATRSGKRGLVTDPAVHEAVDRAASPRRPRSPASSGSRWRPSPITGATGNQEFFLHLRPSDQ